MNVTEIKALLAGYPRERPKLTEAHKKIFVEEYVLNRSGRGLFYGMVAFLETWHHKKVASLKGAGKILEVGAGSLNHVPYEDHLSTYDCVEPFTNLYDASPHRNRVRYLYSDIDEVPTEVRYDRVISVGVLEHLVHLPYIVAKSGRLLEDNGVFQASIPSEGGLLWGMSWRLTTGIAYRLRTGLNYKSVMRHEHINSAPEIIALVRYFFQDVRISRFPLPSHHLSFYTYLEARSPNLARCDDVLNRKLIFEGSAIPS
jgi:hypothetical protein